MNSGDDTYTFTGVHSYTIYDTGGTDTLDFSSYSLNLTINLDEPLSYIGAPLSDSSSGQDEFIYDNGEAYSGYTIGIYHYEEMENVNAGSGDDSITCNSSTNIINCGAGADTVWSVAAGDTVNGDDGNDIFSVINNSFTLINGGDGADTLYLYHGYSANSSGSYSGYVDLRTFTDAQLTSIEYIDISRDGVATSLIVTKAAILDLEPYQLDVDGDGDTDSIVYITASSSDKIIYFPNQGWAYYGSTDSHYFYSTDENNTWFAFNKSAGSIVYVFSSGSPRPLPDDSSDTNPDNDIIPIDPGEDDTPVFPNDDTPPDIDLPDWNLFVAGLDLDSITLPETVVVSENHTLKDLSDLIGLLDDQSESLALDFDHLDSGNPVTASVDSVKPVIVDWIAHTDPFLESDWNPMIEEWVYTAVYS